MKFTIWKFVRDQLSAVPPVTRDDLSGKTVAVIGANGGIGFEAAKHFAEMNPGKLILGCRDRKRGEDALESIKQATGLKTGEVWLIDLKSFASVNAFAERFEKEDERLDILVANAAILASKEVITTSDGWEETFQVNNMSTNLVSLLLVPRLLYTANKYNTVPRLVVVASEVHHFTNLSERVINAKKPFEAFGKAELCVPADFKGDKRYFDTKLLNVFFVRALNERLQDQPLIVNAVNPGFCLSNIRNGFTGLRALLDKIMEALIARTAEQGSRQLIWAALVGKTEADLETMRGAYVSAIAVEEPSDFVISPEGKAFQDRLWDDMMVELYSANPKIQDIAASYFKDSKAL